MAAVSAGREDVVFTAHGNGPAGEGDIVVQSGDARKTVHRGGLFGRYAPSGHLLYVNAGKLFAAPVRSGRLESPVAPCRWWMTWRTR